MIKTTGMILEELGNYRSPADKLSRLVRNGEYIPIVRGLYETEASTPGYLLAGSIYGPSYLSFEFALNYHGLIPEISYTFTSATFEKRKAKSFETPFGTFTYRDIPSSAYPYGIVLGKEGNYSFSIATPEKAICDQLYKTRPVSNYKELSQLLFEDLRIEEEEFSKLNKGNIVFLSEKYQSTNLKKLRGMMGKM